MTRDIFNTAAFILNRKGEIEFDNPLGIETAFRDDRIEIYAQVRPQTGDLQVLYINLNLPFEGRFVNGLLTNDAPFTIPGGQTYELPVFQWAGGKATYYRPGLWETYLARIAEQMERDMQTLQLLNNVPIDDSALFGDVPLGD
jgi:hypothetical protein